MLEASVLFPVIMVPIEPVDEIKKSSEPNVDAGKESKLPLNQTHLSCLFKWKVKLDSDAIPSTFLCSAANIMQVYIVDSDFFCR